MNAHPSTEKDEIMSWKLIGHTDHSLHVHGDLLGRWSAFFNAYDLTVGLLMDFKRAGSTTTIVGLWIQDWDIVVLVTDRGFGKRLRSRAAKIHRMLGKKVIMMDGEPCPGEYDMEFEGIVDSRGVKYDSEFYQFLQCRGCNTLWIVTCQEGQMLYFPTTQTQMLRHRKKPEFCHFCDGPGERHPFIMDELRNAYILASKGPAYTRSHDSLLFNERLCFIDRYET